MAVIKDIYDVLSEVVQGLARVGGIGEDVRTAANAVISAVDPKVAEAEAQAAAAPLSQAEADELARLQERQAAAQAAQPEPADVTAPPVPAPGGGFNQAPAGS
jgi:hypothetical protein